MSKLTPATLSKEEIEEELVNNDLMSSGGVDDQETLQQMNIEEKQELLKCIQQSKEEFQQEAGTSSRTLKKPIIIDTLSSVKKPIIIDTSSSAKKPIIIDTSSSEFPSLAASAKSGNKLKLPRRQSSAPKADLSDSQEPISLLDDEEDMFAKPRKQQLFSLPFCVSDNAPPLPMPERAIRRDECPYYQMRGEVGKEALRRMLAHHDVWKEKYNAEMRKIESRALGENIQDIDEKESKTEGTIDSENDEYTFTEVTKVYSGPASKKRETRKSSENCQSQNSRTPQRRTSRDSDCEEVQPILKPEDPKLAEWVTAARPRNKRNRKQNSNQARAQSQTDIEFDFDNRSSLWGAGRSGGRPQSPVPARRSIHNMPEVEEKVQCPICQRNFTLSTVENHAATCEGFSSSPMDVEEGT